MISEDEGKELAAAMADERYRARYLRKMEELGMKKYAFWLSEEKNQQLDRFLTFLRGESIPEDPEELRLFREYLSSVEAS